MSNITAESPAVHSYLAILQNVIGRMATDSSACKTWCVTLVSAIALVTASKGKPTTVWIALIPVILFLYLDAYYLTLERLFRQRYDDFIKKVQNGTAEVNDTFVVTPVVRLEKSLTVMARAVASFSIWPFYGTLLLVTLSIARYISLGSR